MAMTCFCIDLPSRMMGDRQSFEHQIGRTYVQSLRQPTAAVAYESKVLVDMALEAGFAEARVDHDRGRHPAVPRVHRGRLTPESIGGSGAGGAGA